MLGFGSISAGAISDPLAGVTSTSGVTINVTVIESIALSDQTTTQIQFNSAVLDNNADYDTLSANQSFSENVGIDTASSSDGSIASQVTSVSYTESSITTESEIATDSFATLTITDNVASSDFVSPQYNFFVDVSVSNNISSSEVESIAGGAIIDSVFDNTAISDVSVITQNTSPVVSDINASTDTNSTQVILNLSISDNTSTTSNEVVTFEVIGVSINENTASSDALSIAINYYQLAIADNIASSDSLSGYEVLFSQNVESVSSYESSSTQQIFNLSLTDSISSIESSTALASWNVSVNDIVASRTVENALFIIESASITESVSSSDFNGLFTNFAVTAVSDNSTQSDVIISVQVRGLSSSDVIVSSADTNAVFVIWNTSVSDNAVSSELETYNAGTTLGAADYSQVDDGNTAFLSLYSDLTNNNSTSDTQSVQEVLAVSITENVASFDSLSPNQITQNSVVDSLIGSDINLVNQITSASLFDYEFVFDKLAIQQFFTASQYEVIGASDYYSNQISYSIDYSDSISSSDAIAPANSVLVYVSDSSGASDKYELYFDHNLSVTDDNSVKDHGYIITVGVPTYLAIEPPMLAQNQPCNVTIFMRSSTDHMTSIDNAILDLQISKNGSAFAPVNRTIISMGLSTGVYTIQLLSEDTSEIGELILVANGQGCDQSLRITNVVPDETLDNTKITDLWRVNGLDPLNPLNVTQTARNAGGVLNQLIVSDSTHTTISRI